MEDFIKDLKLENIEKYGLKIYQDPRYFKFSIDAFCLANFTLANFHKSSPNYVDLCSGTGIVALIAEKMAGLGNFKAVEINEYAYKILLENLKINESTGSALNIDLRQWRDHIARESLDLITVNPPYAKLNAGLQTKNAHKDMAKIETFENFLHVLFSESYAMLKDRGSLFMVHRIERLADLFIEGRKNRLEPKTLQFIRNTGSTRSSLVLVQFVKNAGQFLKVLDDMVV